MTVADRKGRFLAGGGWDAHPNYDQVPIFLDIKRHGTLVKYPIPILIMHLS